MEREGDWTGKGIRYEEVAGCTCLYLEVVEERCISKCEYIKSIDSGESSVQHGLRVWRFVLGILP